MNNTILQRLSREQIAEIYHTYMETDFPPDELRPLDELMERLERGIYECLGLFEAGRLRAYGYFVKDEEEKRLLLDFLAVCPECRGGGYGSRFLQSMAEYYSSYRGIMLECESEQTAADEADLEVRIRRMAFYEKNGCVRTRTKTNLFGVEFTVFYLPVGDAGLDVLELEKPMKRMYALMFTEEKAGNVPESGTGTGV